MQGAHQPPSEAAGGESWPAGGASTPGAAAAADDVRAALDAPCFDRLWCDLAAALGFRVERSGAAYASSDGRGTITIGTRETLDAEDSLAQLVFHELCHALVEGEAGLALPDWGLDNTSDRDTEREHACLHLQAYLAQRHGLREAMAPTTVVRAYYDGLPREPLAGAGAPARRARATIEGALFAAWAGPIDACLAATAAVLAGRAEAPR